MDLSFSNKQIKSYFDGQSQDPPCAEFMYLHSHRIRGNFVEQIEKMILQAGEKIEAQPMRYKAVSAKLLQLTIQLGQQVEDVSEKNAPEILKTLRQIYALCGTITGLARP